MMRTTTRRRRLDPMELAPASIPVRRAFVDPTAGWAGRQGVEWYERNPVDAESLDASYRSRFGISRTDVNLWALEGVPKDASVLEVGCSAGAQLNAMAAVGYTNLEGCDICADALKVCPWPHKLADGRALPYDSGSFDVVMTSGTLMQIPPGAKAQFVAECYRVAKRWVYGVEGSTPYRGEWRFGDLIPPAWTEPYPEAIMRPGWRLVRDRWLHNNPGMGQISLRAYLLEREGT